MPPEGTTGGEAELSPSPMFGRCRLDCDKEMTGEVEDAEACATLPQASSATQPSASFASPVISLSQSSLHLPNIGDGDTSASLPVAPSDDIVTTGHPQRYFSSTNPKTISISISPATHNGSSVAELSDV